MDADQAESAEIDANLIPADLSPADQALHVDARKTLYEKLHPRRSNLMRPVRILSFLANQSALWPERKLVQQAGNERVTTCRAERGSVNLDNNAVAQADALACLGFDELREHGHRSQ
jgi:hypothetical protein